MVQGTPSEKFECAMGFHTKTDVTFEITRSNFCDIPRGGFRVTTKVCKHCGTFLEPVGFPKNMKDEYMKTGRRKFSWEEYNKPFDLDDDATNKH